MPATIQLESEAQAFAEATANPPYLFDLGPEKGRPVVDEVQSGAVDKLLGENCGACSNWCAYIVACNRTSCTTQR